VFHILRLSSAGFLKKELILMLRVFAVFYKSPEFIFFVLKTGVDKERHPLL